MAFGMHGAFFLGKGVYWRALKFNDRWDGRMLYTISRGQGEDIQIGDTMGMEGFVGNR
jgi:hypothetical protein